MAGPVRHDAVAILNVAGLNRGELKVKESPACAKRLTDLSAYDVSTREPGKRAGKHVVTLVYFPGERMGAYAEQHNAN